MFKIKEKAVNVPAFNLLLYEQYIHNPFVNPESMNTTYPEKCGTLHAQFFAKCPKCTPLIYVKQHLSILKTVGVLSVQ